MTSFDLQIEGSETIVCTASDENAIRTISMTFGNLSGRDSAPITSAQNSNMSTEVLQMYHRLQDIVREWNVLNTKRIGEYEVKKEW